MLERVQKIIANAGFCSRRAAEDLIEEGRVTVNGKQIELGAKANVDIDIIRIDDRKLARDVKKYVMLNKPKFYETTLATKTAKRSIVSLLKYKQRLFPIGRLDFTSEGLLLLTNDGDFANLIMHPRYVIDKTYEALLDKPLSEEDNKQLKKGIRLKDGMVKGIRIKVASHDRKKVEISLHEGRNKIVKRIFNELGYYVNKLKRTKIGPLVLGNLKPGKTRELTDKEVDQLRKTALKN